MSRADFDKFVQRKQEEGKQAAQFDPKQQLAEWLQYLDALYRQIEKTVSAYIERGVATIEFHKIELNEDFSGLYNAPQMLLRIGSSTIVFKPIGTMLIGSKGRVDVQGPQGSARLSLIDKNVTHARQLVRIRVSKPDDPPQEPKRDKIEWVWKIMTPAPEMNFVELTEDSFFDMILSITDA